MNDIRENDIILSQQDLSVDVEDSAGNNPKHSDEYYEAYIQSFEPNLKKKFFYRFVKRGFDIVFSILLSILLALPMLIIGIAVKIDSKGPAIFKQKRMGKNGKTFTLYKFRSMTLDTPHDCATSRLGPADHYLTRVGKFLRRFSLDELPQLWCILIGTMSFIGYRPVVLTEKHCNEMRQKLNVFVAKPGVSGYAQVNGRDDVYYKDKVIMDAEYVKKANLWFDLKLIFQTIFVVISGRGNDSHKSDKENK